MRVECNRYYSDERSVGDLFIFECAVVRAGGREASNVYCNFIDRIVSKTKKKSYEKYFMLM
jgi:hypothetical protein